MKKLFLSIIAVILFSCCQAQNNTNKEVKAVVMLRTTANYSGTSFYWYKDGIRQNTTFSVPKGEVLVITDITGNINFLQSANNMRYFSIGYNATQYAEAAVILKRWQKTAPVETIQVDEHYNTGIIIPANSKMNWAVMGTDNGYVEISVLGYLSNDITNANPTLIRRGNQVP